MSETTTRSDTPRHELMRRAHVRERIAEHPRARQYGVAHHYVSLCSHALFMERLLDERRFTEESQELEKSIAECERMIVEAHVRDFGVEPTWWPGPAPSKEDMR